MNIFYLDSNPRKSVEYLCDKHVIKMVTESVQILSSAYYLVTQTQGCYKPTHLYHPCVKWAAESKENFTWLMTYIFCISGEYTKRYKKTHGAYTKYANWINSVDLDTLVFPLKYSTELPKCMPEKYRHLEIVSAYRTYYKTEKSKFAVWKHTNLPDWW